MTALIVADGLTVRYGQQPPILWQTDLTIATNEIVALVGPSGCGKSTLLNAIAGFIPYEGRLTMSGQAITGPASQRGVVFQNSSLYPWYDVAQNIGFGLRAAQQAPATVQARVAQLLQLIDLEAQAHKKVFALSGGMRQRVAIARALAPRPPLLLLDEPFGALDAFTRQKMQQLMLSIWRQEQVSLLLITHDLNEALFCGSRIAVMTSTSRQLIATLANPYQGQTDLDLGNTQLQQRERFQQQLLALINQ
ncbi:ABC transporter ATP-binding protein [Lapidilactobacillus salsurivasis]